VGKNLRTSSVPALKTKTLSVIAYANEGRSAADCGRRSRSARDLPQTLAGRKSQLSARPHPADRRMPL